jgi:hypothetical protein
LFSSLLFSSGESRCQSKIFTDSVYTFSEVSPEYPGGKRALIDYITAEMYLPINCKKENIDSKINVSFIIDAEGLVQNVTFLEKIECADFEAIIKKIFYFMPKWKPGEQGGEKVNVKMNFPIYINLQ